MNFPYTTFPKKLLLLTKLTIDIDTYDRIIVITEAIKRKIIGFVFIISIVFVPFKSNTANVPDKKKK